MYVNRPSDLEVRQTFICSIFAIPWNIEKNRLIQIKMTLDTNANDSLD